MGKRKGRRRKGIKWDYNGDGRFPEERYTTFDKRYWRRYWRREGQAELESIRLDEELVSKTSEVKYPLRVRVSHSPLDDIPERENSSQKLNLEETNSVNLRPDIPERE